MRFIHTADLQIGARFAQFGDRAAVLREARVQALARVLDIAATESADAILIAGDLFEDNQVADSLVREVLDVLAAHDRVPVVILPGNHDPVSGPGCVWLRPPFDQPPAHVTVCTSSAPMALGDAVILPSPIAQKRSTRDPALPLGDAAGMVPEGKIAIGLTHGSLAIESMHQPDDHPIAVDAATRAKLDYLAVGHWHSYMVLDDDRLVMPGTPEPDQFGQAPGHVVRADIAGPGARPVLTQIPSAIFTWQEVLVDTTDEGSPDALLGRALAECVGAPEHVVLRVRLQGATDPARRVAFARCAETLSAAYAVAQVQDDTVVRLTDAMWQAWQQEHPLLAQSVADVEQARLFHTGTAPDVATDGLSILTLGELRTVCEQAGIGDGNLNEQTFEAALELLIGTISAFVAGETAS